ncbi:MAG: tyrosine-type recombinase/integrase [Actinobacteria bacterium]|nr:tyrosine-type recombinase/integrase [Actinomycetota bacterium]
MPSAQKAGSAEPVDVDALLAAYRAWLARQSLATRSQQAYAAQVARFLSWLVSSEHGARALSDAHVRDWAVRDYKRHVKSEARWAPSSVNQALAAIDNFYRSLGAGRPDVAREDLPQLAPRALQESEQRRFLRAVEASPSPRDRAIATVFFYTALRLSELAALELQDVSVTARRGMVRVRAGKGDAYREVPLNSACRKALDEWSQARTATSEVDALWLSRQGTRMSSRAIDLVIRRLAKDAGLELSAHTLRHTAVTNLIRSGADVVLVAELAGHRRLDTTRRYSLPSAADRDGALEAILVDI